MNTNLLRLSGFTREDRNAMLFHIDQAIGQAQGWIADFKEYSNKSAMLVFELPISALSVFERELQAIPLTLFAESKQILQQYIQSLAEQESDQPSNSSFSAFADTESFRVSLQVTFIHNDPDLRIEVPAVPG